MTRIASGRPSSFPRCMRKSRAGLGRTGKSGAPWETNTVGKTAISSDDCYLPKCFSRNSLLQHYYCLDVNSFGKNFSDPLRPLFHEEVPCWARSHRQIQPTVGANTVGKAAISFDDDYFPKCFSSKILVLIVFCNKMFEIKHFVAPLFKGVLLIESTSSSY